MISKKLEEISLADIQSLVRDQARESKTLEFKRDQIGTRDDDKREFLADVSAIANTLGGDLVIGIEDTGGQASALVALRVADPDAEILRLENMLRSGLEPRLPRVDMRWIAEAPGIGFILVRIPRSWAAPHRVIFRDHSKFYARNSSAKYPMDVGELRSAFNSEESLTTRIRKFRTDRLTTISANDGPVALNEGPILVLHMLPVSAFTDPTTISPDERTLFRPIRSTGFNYLHTLEGFATYTGREEAETSRAYAMAFRNGIVEAAAQVGYQTDGGKIIYPDSVEGGLLEVVDSYFHQLENLGIEPPYYVSFSLLGARGFSLYTGNRRFFDARPPLRRDALILPEVFVDVPRPNVVELLKPLFDMFWQAFGYQKTYSFDANGRYIGDR